MNNIQPYQLGCYKQVVSVLGEEQATIELGKVLDTNPGWLDIQEKDVWDSFSFDDSPQGYDFWDGVCDDASLTFGEGVVSDMQFNTLREITNKLCTVIYDNEEAFLSKFCKFNATDLTEVSFNDIYVKAVYISYEGAHICDSVDLCEVEKWCGGLSYASQ